MDHSPAHEAPAHEAPAHEAPTDDTAIGRARTEPAPGRRATIRDVAREAGVSRQTVTRAMNDMSEISAATRERVLAVSEALGYVPSRFAANLARQKSVAIGLVITSLRNPYYTDLAADLLEEFAARGWQVVVVAESHGAEDRIVADLSAQVDAIIGYFPRASVESIRRAARGVPVVLIEREAELPGAHSIAVDFAPGMRELVDGLRERGARSIGMIDHAERGGYAASERCLRYAECLEPGEVALVTSGQETIEGGAAAFGELVAAHPGVDAVIAFNDMMAIGALQRASRLGLRVPQDVRIAGIDGLSIGAAMIPSLTSLAIDRARIARSAAAMLSELLTGGSGPTPAREPAPSPAQSIVITPRPEWRDSA
ncbi:LacI family DNA-binding transcriptional regulator [Rathayibacter sp. VKM Ac-2760]|uniref:LacI family DNA-binding transcriptional regulator n=1 Tax=Rathayibacter sp. VKM Ac-2760 TaxID=2609253 RepID=UPI00131746C6|nr:LacI family DNA-binding transcriptional regulator [Rathayibacter sp. VKM Ac-2760]QHC58898.1 substrate-binding domain-containing protein [Rathayibacter sp. VKM Ac-2760]